MKIVRSGCLVLIGLFIFAAIVQATNEGGGTTSSGSGLGTEPTTSPKPYAGNDNVVQFDRDAEIKKNQYSHLETGTVLCMDRFIHGLLMQGLRDRQKLIGMSASVCGNALEKFIVETGGQKKEIANGYVLMLASQELQNVLDSSDR